MSTEKTKYTVLVTGFGPFQGFPVNFSWETVKNLWCLDWPENVKLITRELPVIYDSVFQIVPQLWSEIKPDV
jgi:pyroglutamyl-peptidase